MISSEAAKQLLQPQQDFSLHQLNALCRLPPMALIAANSHGLITRSLGEGLQLHIMGVDIIDFLETCEVHGVPECIVAPTRHAQARVGRRQRRDAPPIGLLRSPD